MRFSQDMRIVTIAQFFITFYEELQTRARAKKSEDESNHLAGGMSYGEVKDRTSSTVGTEEDDGMVFDETITAFAMRRKAALDFLISAVVASHQKAFRPYISSAQWTTIVEDAGSVDLYHLSISAELAEPLAVTIKAPVSPLVPMMH